MAPRKIREANPEQLVLVLTGAREEEFGMLAPQVGAGFLSKELDIGVLPRALEAALDREGVTSREMTRRLIACLRGGAQQQLGPVTDQSPKATYRVRMRDHRPPDLDRPYPN